MLNVYAGLSLGVSGLILLMLALKPLLKKRYSARWGYLAWILLCVFLVIPFGKLLPKAPNRVVIPMPEQTLETSKEPMQLTADASQGEPEKTVAVSAQNEAVSLSDTSADTSTDTEDSPITTVKRIDVWGVATVIWIAGILAFLLYIGASYVAFLKQFKRIATASPDEETLELYRQAEAEVGGRRKAELLIADELPSPFLMGFLRPKILLPKESVGCPGLKLILKHELIHLKRGDLFIKLFAVAANAIHWFNPFAYVLRRRMDVDCEFSCDERVLRGEPMENRYSYGETVLAVTRRASRQTTVFTSNFNPRKGTMKMRLHNILDSKVKKPGVLALTALFLTMILISSTVVFADGSSQANFFGTIQVPGSITKVESDAYSVTLYIGDKLAGGAKTVAYNAVDPNGITISTDFVEDGRAESTINGFKAYSCVLTSLTNDETEHHIYVVDEGHQVVFEFYGIDSVASSDLANTLVTSWKYTEPTFAVEGYTPVTLDMAKQKEIQAACDAGTDTNSTLFYRVGASYIAQYYKDAGIAVKMIGISSSSRSMKNPYGVMASVRIIRQYCDPDKCLEVFLIQPCDSGDTGIWAVVGYREIKPLQTMAKLAAPTLKNAKSSAMYCVGKRNEVPTHNIGLAEEFVKKMDAGTPAKVDLMQFSTEGKLISWERLSYDGKIGTDIYIIPRADGGYNFYKVFEFTKMEIKDVASTGKTAFFATLTEGYDTCFYAVVKPTK